MKKFQKKLYLCVMMLCMAMMFSACGSATDIVKETMKKQTEDKEDQEEETKEAEEGEEAKEETEAADGEEKA